MAEVTTVLDALQGRLKSLYSVWKKMMRKGASLAEIYDARALRVVVDDQEGAKTQASPRELLHSLCWLHGTATLSWSDATMMPYSPQIQSLVHGAAVSTA